MKRQKRMIPLALAVVMTVSSPASAWAASLADYDEATQERLKDNVLEYDELGALIAVYNPTMQSANDTLQSAIDELNTTITDIETNIRSLESTAENRKDEGDIDGYVAYKTAETIAKKGVVKTLKNRAEQATSYTATKDLRTLEYNLTSVSQMLMSSYQSATAQREVAAKGKELAEAAYGTAQTQMGIGMATQTDLLQAQKNLEEATNGLAQVDAILIQLRQNLCMMTGWSYDAMPEIRTIPAVDMEWINSMNLEADTVKALGNNVTLIQQRAGGSSGSTTVSRNRRSRDITESEQKLRIEMEQLYLAVQQKKTELDAANSAYASAESAKRAADAKNQMGMLGRPEYLQAEMAFLTQKATKVGADMALLQAVNDYAWGVKGLATIE